MTLAHLYLMSSNGGTKILVSTNVDTSSIGVKACFLDQVFLKNALNINDIFPEQSILYFMMLPLK